MIDKEMYGESAITLLRRSIPEKRDRRQSQVLNWAVGTGLLILVLTRTVSTRNDLPPHWFLVSCAVSFTFALLTWVLRAATPTAALAGGIVCLSLLQRQTIGGPWWSTTAIPALVTLFFITFAATSFGKREKEKIGTGEARTGRQPSQVIANLGVAGLCGGSASIAIYVACIAALAEATADTISSEVGQVAGGTPRLITSWKRVPTGTNGAVTILGTTCGLIGAVLIVAITGITNGLHGITLWIALLAGCAGSWFDSLLGATAEHKGWLGNDLVNFLSTMLSALAAYIAVRLFAT